MTQPTLKLDSNDLAFFNRELEYIKAKSYDTKQRMLKAAQLVPVSTEAGAGAREITFRRYTEVGTARIISDYAKDIPRADIYGEEETIKVKHIASSYGYSIFEIQESRRVNRRLDARRAKAANRAVDERMDRLVWFGSTAHNIQGLLDYPGILEYTVPNGASPAAPQWDGKTSAEILVDMNAMISTPVEATNEVERPNTLLLPVHQYELIASMRNSDSSDLTVLEYFKRNRPGVLVETLDYLKNAGGSTVDRMLAYVRDTDHLTQEMPVPRRQEAPQQDGLEVEVIVWADHAGVIVYYPLSVIFADNI